MPFCPECRSEYRADMTTCPVCNEPLIESLPPDVRSMDANELRAYLKDKELVGIRRGMFDGIKEVHLFLLHHRVANIITEYSARGRDRTGYAQLYDISVAAEDIGRALQLLEEKWVDGHAETADAQGDVHGYIAEKDGMVQCPACETMVPADATECPECGLFLNPEAGRDDAGEDKGQED